MKDKIEEAIDQLVEAEQSYFPLDRGYKRRNTLATKRLQKADQLNKALQDVEEAIEEKTSEYSDTIAGVSFKRSVDVQHDFLSVDCEFSLVGGTKKQARITYSKGATRDTEDQYVYRVTSPRLRVPEFEFISASDCAVTLVAKILE